MSNKPKCNLDKISATSNKIFEDCKKKYGLTIKDVIPHGKRKEQPYIIDDFRKACTKKRKQTQKNKSLKSSSKKIMGYKVTLYLTNPSQKTSQSFSNMNINTFKKWCNKELALEVGQMGFEICKESYKVVDKTTLYMQFFVDNPNINAPENSLDAILNRDDDGYSNVQFQVTNKKITPVYKKIICT